MCGRTFSESEEKKNNSIEFVPVHGIRLTYIQSTDRSSSDETSVMSDILQLPSRDEVRVVAELRERLEPLLDSLSSSSSGGDERMKKDFFTDTCILRFLRGRKHDKERAYRAMNRFFEWRRENSVDLIDPSYILKEVDSGKISATDNRFDKLGRPVITIIANKHNMHDRDIDVMKSFIISVLEEALKKTNPIDEKIVILFDLQAFTLNCMDYDVVKMLIEILQFNYPETLAVALIVNAPFIFNACWMLISGLLDPITAKKVVFCSNNSRVREVLGEGADLVIKSQPTSSVNLEAMVTDDQK